MSDDPAIRKSERDCLGELLDNLQASLQTVLAGIPESPPQPVEVPVPSSSRTPKAAALDTFLVRQTIAQLDDLLEKNNLGAKRLLVPLRDLLTDAGASQSLAQLEACVNKLDFKGARVVLASLAQEFSVSLP